MVNNENNFNIPGFKDAFFDFGRDETSKITCSINASVIKHVINTHIEKSKYHITRYVRVTWKWNISVKRQSAAIAIYIFFHMRYHNCNEFFTHLKTWHTFEKVRTTTVTTLYLKHEMETCVEYSVCMQFEKVFLRIGSKIKQIHLSKTDNQLL